MKNDNRWIEIIKKEVENQINQEYTEYKDKIKQYFEQLAKEKE